ncbi:MAG: molecular chaperone HtpG [Anaerolineaceae bacterium 4572_5.2]|nr:MAG: molecular chaperone HtpG [Anaerolineaceae bacterium 4572_5.2]
MTQTNPESFKFKAEVQQLLNILVHSLYTDKEIFLRELISNASDALNRMQFEMLTNHDVLDPEAEPGIWISGDKEAKTITIRDTGIGMTREELIDNLGTIAKSGAADFIARLKDNKEQVADVIGQFGVGFYSVFMVAKEVEVVSRSYRNNAEAVKWVSDGSESYTIQTTDKAERGTTITITLHDEDAEFAQEYRLRNIIKKHSDFVTYPIYLGDSEGAANQQTPLWRQSASDIDEEKYKEFYKQLTLDFEDPIARLHLSADAPVQLNALLFFPARREGNILSLRKDPGLKLYSHNVLIQEYNTDLLPNHFRFVQGVVDSEDISLSVSREAVQNTRVVEKLKNLLTKRVVRKLEDLGKEDADKYAQWWKEFGMFIKEGIATDINAKDSLAKLLRFYSSASPDKLISLADYVEAMPEDQEAIYYILADSAAAAKNSPHLDDFKKRDIQVLYMVDTLDSFMLTALREFNGHNLQNVDAAELEETEEEKAAEEEAKAKLPDDRFAEVITRFKSVLGDKVEDVKEAKRLSSSPVRLVAPEGAEGQEMDRIRRVLEQDYEIPKRVLTINRGHAIIRNIADLIGKDTALADTAIEQIFDSALLSEGLHPNPAEMIPRIQELIEAATGK